MRLICNHNCICEDADINKYNLSFQNLSELIFLSSLHNGSQYSLSSIDTNILIQYACKSNNENNLI